ncbi:MAG: transcriptional repressor [Bacteroidetes bacterium]|nr:MAG: transcriptional repressor [Bacteroidota bacterium]
MTTENILRRHDLRRTSNRTAILDVFVAQEVALSEREIEEAMSQTCDRVTIYRTLNSFLERGVIHRVLDDSGVMKYALCAADCAHHEAHYHDHVHFKCRMCGQTTCIEQVQIPKVILPEGFALEEVNMLLQGVCPECRG